MQVTDEMVAAAQDATPRWMNATDSEIRYIIEAALEAMPKATGGYVDGDSIRVRLSDASCTYTLPPDMVRGELPPNATVSINLGAAADKTIIETLSRVLGSLTERKVDSALDILGGKPLVEVNLGGDIIPDRDGVRRIVRTKPRGDAGEPMPLGDADPYGPLPPMVIPADHPLLDTRGFDDLSAPTPNVQQSIPVTEPRVPIAESALHLYLGVKREVIARMVVQRDDYRPPMPRPVRENDHHEPLYDGEAVKAWYDALPQAADG